ncbi:MAG: hypothetical protein KDB07_00860 [Planctomycetes bacterium]|nr:hypothetical protein [Planctomycetota bacterium]
MASTPPLGVYTHYSTVGGKAIKPRTLSLPKLGQLPMPVMVVAMVNMVFVVEVERRIYERVVNRMTAREHWNHKRQKQET